jgi:hypothetical protein
MKRISNDTLLAFFGLALFLAFTLGLYLGSKTEAGIQKQIAVHQAAAAEVGR